MEWCLLNASRRSYSPNKIELSESSLTQIKKILQNLFYEHFRKYQRPCEPSLTEPEKSESPASDDQLWTTEQVGKYLHVSLKTVFNLRKKGLPYVHWAEPSLSPQEIKDYLVTNRVVGAPFTASCAERYHRMIGPHHASPVLTTMTGREARPSGQ